MKGFSTTSGAFVRFMNKLDAPEVWGNGTTAEAAKSDSATPHSKGSAGSSLALSDQLRNADQF
jgi:hypothetical protein